MHRLYWVLLALPLLGKSYAVDGIVVAVDPTALTMLVFLGLVTYVPELSLWLPRVLGML